jgi:hypothetical protein
VKGLVKARGIIGGRQMCRPIGLALMLALGASNLAAQATWGGKLMPIPPGATRDYQLEHGNADDTTARSWTQVYRYEATAELVFRWYQDRMGLKPRLAIDTATIQPGSTTPVTYHLTMHTFDDQCLDPVDTVATEGPPPADCTKWRRGKEKRHVLGVRIGVEPNRWIERAVLTWYSRSEDGVLTKRSIELIDTGLARDWKRYDPRTEVILHKETEGQPR